MLFCRSEGLVMSTSEGICQRACVRHAFMYARVRGMSVCMNLVIAYNLIARLAGVNEVIEQDGVLGPWQSASWHLARTLLQRDSLVVLVERLQTDRQTRCRPMDEYNQQHCKDWM